MLVLFMVAWVGVRGLMAVRDLRAAASLVSTLRSNVSAGDIAGARGAGQALQKKAEAARSLTADPVWRAAEILPLVGPNMRALRQVSAVVANVADGAVRPALSVIDRVNVRSFEPRGGTIELAPLAASRTNVDLAARTLKRAKSDVRKINTRKTITAVTSQVHQLANTLSSVASEAETASRVVDLVPAMLGAHGARNYLLLVENNAELRAGGGIAGTVVLLHVDNGRVTLAAQAAGGSFPKSAKPVLPLPNETVGLYGAITGEYMQDVTLTPRFSTTARLASEFWKRRYGQDIDGVVSIDPVTLGYVLNATGPVVLDTGATIDAGNAARLLLNDVYLQYPDPRVQDAFFASAAKSIFSAVTAKSLDPGKMLQALSAGIKERRVMIWSAHRAEQRRLSESAAAGSLPASPPGSARFGVYLNDATGAKMDYYLMERVAVGSKVCRADGRPTWTVQVTLKNKAPADAATSLPRYVTGGGDFGVSPGNVGTNVVIYAPKTGVFLGASQDGRTASPQTALDGEYPVVQLPTLLSPGQSTTLTVQFLGPKSAAGHTIAADSTPGVRQAVTQPVDVTCETR